MSNNIPILMYHNITDDKNDTSAIYYKDFYNQIKLLTNLNYKSSNLKDICNENYKKKFVITFDDGYENISKIAQDILLEFNQRATCFIVYNRIDKVNDWDQFSKNSNLSKIMNFNQINEWINNGFEIGSHTLDHKNLTSLSVNEKKTQICESANQLNKKFDINVVSFSYPYGKYDNECLNILEKNYDYAVITKKSLFNPLKNKMHEIPRISISRKTSTFKFLLKTLTIYENLKF